MRTSTLFTSPLLLGLLVLAGCASSHDTPLPDEPRPDEPLPDEPLLTALPGVGVLPSALVFPMGCFEDGGHLELVAAIDNDDVSEHGDVLTFAVAPDRRIAVASEDGTVKLWTLEGFVGELSPGALIYGVETDLPQVSDLTFWDGQIVMGDVQGVVSAWTVEGGLTRVLGGVEPNIQIRAVALDEARGLVAHADERQGGNIMVRGLEDATTFGPLATELGDVTDMAYLADGRLVVGGLASGPRIEVRDADDPTVTSAEWWAFDGESIQELATDGERVAAVTPQMLGVFDGELLTLAEADLEDHAPVSVTVRGDVVYTVGAEGSLAAWSLDGLTLLARVDVPDPVRVRVDPVAGVVLVASRDGGIRAFDCVR